MYVASVLGQLNSHKTFAMRLQIHSSIHATAVIIIAVVLHCSPPCSSIDFIQTPSTNGMVYTGKVSIIQYADKTYRTAQFLGIPYAKPPIGVLRFSKPELLQLNETYNATEFKNICYQKNNSNDHCQKFGEMSEDCLYLNIYVPLKAPETPASAATEITTSTLVSTASKAVVSSAAETSLPANETTTSTPAPTTKVPTIITPAITASDTTPTRSSASDTSTKDTSQMKLANSLQPSYTVITDTTNLYPFISSTEKSSQKTENSNEANDQAKDEVSRTLTTNKKLAVFIYIHGGAYFEGNANCYNGSILAGFGDIIVVTINYRLGPLGFLTTGDDVIPGNLGLWDQFAAIKWVKENIERFGGDPTRITVGGQSAGSYSSIFQALNPQSDGLFQRIIAQSGTPLAKNSVIQNGNETAFEVAKQHGCPVQTREKSSAIRDCLMKVNPADLVHLDAPNLIPSSLPLEPTLDGHFITSDPRQVISANFETQSHFTNKDLLIGFDAEDGEVVYRLWAILNSNKFKNTTYLKETLTRPISMNTFRQIVFEYLAESFEEDIESYRNIIDLVVDRYLDWEGYVSLSNRAVAMLTDVFFILPVAETALAHTEILPTTSAPPHSEHDSGKRRRDVDDESDGNTKLTDVRRGSTYVYKFKLLETDVNFQNKWFNWFNGTNHGAEVRYVFGDVADIADVALSSVVMTYWSNFIKYGNPNQASEPVTESNNVLSEQSSTDPPSFLLNWPGFTRDQQSFLEISTELTPRTLLGSAGHHFWYDLVPSLRKAMQERYEACVKSVNLTQNCVDQTQKNTHQAQCNHGSQSGVTVKTWVILLTTLLAFL